MIGKNKAQLNVTISPWLKKRVEEIAATDDFSSMSDVVSQSISEFIARYDEKKSREAYCPQCNARLDISDKFCSKCGLIIDRETREEIEKYKDKLPELLQLLMKSETAREMLESMAESEKKDNENQ